MRDDIPTLLRDAAADPSRTPDFDELAARGRRQHLAARASTALVAVVALLAGGIVLWPDGQPARAPVIGEQPTVPDHAEQSVTVPDGWHDVTVGEAVLGVPDDWVLEVFNEPADVCVNGPQEPTAVVMHAGPVPENRCKAQGMAARVLQAAPLSTVPPAWLDPPAGEQWRTATAGDVSGQVLVRNNHGTVAYQFPTLDLWLQFNAPDPIGSWADDILATLAAATDTDGSRDDSQPSCPDGDANAVIEWVSFVQVGPRMMTEVGEAGPIAREQLGRQVLETRCRIADEASTEYSPRPGDASFLPPGTPVYAIAGTDPGFRVVADDDGELRLFQVMTAQDAETARDVFDIDGRVTRIDVSRDHVVDGTTTTGEIVNPTDVREVVDALLTSEVTPERQPSTNEVTYRVMLHLREGPPVELRLYPSDNLIGHPWITVSASLTDQIEQAATGGDAAAAVVLDGSQVQTLAAAATHDPSLKGHVVLDSESLASVWDMANVSGAPPTLPDSTVGVFVIARQRESTCRSTDDVLGVRVDDMATVLLDRDGEFLRPCPGPERSHAYTAFVVAIPDEYAAQLEGATSELATPSD